MTQYYQISETGYPIISPIMLDGFTAYEVGKEPKVLRDAFRNNERKEKIEKLKSKFTERANPTKIEMLVIHLGIAVSLYLSQG